MRLEDTVGFTFAMCLAGAIRYSGARGEVWRRRLYCVMSDDPDPEEYAEAYRACALLNRTPVPSIYDKRKVCSGPAGYGQLSKAETDKINRDVVSLVLHGHPYRDVAVMVGLHRQATARIYKKYGPQSNTEIAQYWNDHSDGVCRKHLFDSKHHPILDGIARGKSLKAISEEMNISEKTIYHRFERMKATAVRHGGRKGKSSALGHAPFLSWYLGGVTA